jgi:RHS repeat-associated protein
LKHIFNRLVGRDLDPDGAGEQPATSTFYVYDGSQILLEFAGGSAGDLSHRYLWGPVVDEILADETADDGGVEDVLWPLTDHLGTVRDLATYDGQATSIANHRVFDAFGNITSETAPTVDHLFAFTDRPFDEETGLQNNLNRWYDPKVGRWLSEDPIGFAGESFNVSCYVGNSPLEKTDSEGLGCNNGESGSATPGNNAKALEKRLPPVSPKSRFWIVAFVNVNDDGIGSMGGHSWVAIIDRQSHNVDARGFFPADSGVMDGKPHPSKIEFKGELGRGYFRARAYRIEPAQFDAAFNEMDRWRDGTRTGNKHYCYDANDRNCTHFVLAVLKAAGKGVECGVDRQACDRPGNNGSGADYTPRRLSSAIKGDNQPNSLLFEQKN